MKKYLWVTIISIIVCVACYLCLEDFLFTENNARELVQEQGILLKENFELLINESSSPFVVGADYYHTFTLSISAADAQRAIESKRNSPNFIRNPDSVNSMLYMRSEGRYTGPTITQEYEAGGWYVREYFKPYGEENYAPTFRRISVTPQGNNLKFEDIAE